MGILGVVFVTNLAPGSEKTARSAATTTALAKAKDALIAYAIARDDPGRPGEFPCPSIVPPTAPTYGVSASACATVSIGRLPWKTLGIAEPLDSDAEPLWYAVSSKFRPPFSNTRLINSDTVGNLAVYDSSGSTVLSSEVVAVIFAAGAPTSSQNRTSTTMVCATTATSIAGNSCATNYLDSDFGRNNATNSGPYIAGTSNANFNDQIAYITTADFIPKIEDRIATFLTRSLKSYYVANGYYPYSTTYSDISFPNRLNCANGTYSGRLPVFIAASPYGPPVAPCIGLQEWPGVGIPNSLPTWFSENQWSVAIHYKIGKAFEKGGSKVCSALGDCLTVNGDSAVQAMLILPGIATASQIRPFATPANYLEVAGNLGGWPLPVNYSYMTTNSSLPSRDRVVAIKYPP